MKIKRKGNLEPKVHHGRQAEVYAAKRMGAKLTRNSGSKDNDKGDMKVGTFLIEAKSTCVDSLTVQREWLAKIVQEAGETEKDPALLIMFVNEQGQLMNVNSSWVCIPEQVFMELIDTENYDD